MWRLTGKTLRFSQHQRPVSHATPKMLTRQLRKLEADRLIVRMVYPVAPPKTEYSLSEKGESMVPILNVMCDWGRDYLKELGALKCCNKNSD